MINPTNSSLTRVALLVLLQLSVGSVASAQDSRASSRDPDAVVQAKSDSDGLPKFEIEIVVFAYNEFDPVDENFSRERAAQKAEGLPAAGGRLASKEDEDWSAKAPVRFEMLEPADLKLTAACDKLKRLDAYTVLVHGGWIQEGLPEEGAPEIDMSLFGDPRVSGTLRFYLGRYAHVTAAIDYHASTDASSPLRTVSPGIHEESTSSRRMFELRQTRRMRSGELHYFDHPAFGLLVTVRRHAEMHENAASAGASSGRTAGPSA